jgi:hypothetical protein
MGKVYMVEGEFGLAEAQFGRALDMAVAAGMEEDAVAYRYQIADLNLLWRNADRIERAKHLQAMEKALHRHRRAGSAVV